MQNDNRNIKTATRSDGDRLVFVVEGSAESDSMDALATAIARVDRDARTANVPQVVADLTALEFCTSSCLKVLATWVVEQPSPSPYRIVFLSNPKHSWQRRSLRALTAVAPEIATVEESA